MKRVNPFWWVVAVLSLLLVTVSGAAVGQSTGAPRQVTNAQTGNARLLAFEAGALGLPGRDVREAALTTSADVVARYASAFGSSADSAYSVASEPFTLTQSAMGVTAVRYTQSLGGIPVYASQLVVNVRGDGAALLMTGKVSTATAASLTLTPAVSAAVAGQSALTYVSVRYGVPVASLQLEDAGLWVYDPAIVKPGVASVDRAGVVWQAVVSSRVGQPIRVVALVDAQKARVRFSFNSIHASPQHGDWQSARNAGVNFGAGLVGPAASNALDLPTVRVAGTADLATYDANNGKNLPGTFVCDETNMACTNGSDPDADSAHKFAKGTYDFYWNTHQRDSLDNAGLQLKSTVHLEVNFCNAFWNGTQMAYGDGCPSSIVVDDVVGHELTHGVTEYTSNLIYAYDSGAINESFSDVWGEAYDLNNATAEDISGNRWVVGEEIQAGGFRNMLDPTVWNDPDRVGSSLFWTDARDSGGVHINSGINNRAFSFMVDGGTFNGHTITGLGFTKALAVYYYVQTMMATPSTTYNDLADYLKDGCNAAVTAGLGGLVAADCDTVDEVVQASEMSLPSPHLPDSATVCDGGLLPSTLFSDNFESATASAANWTTAALKGKNAWTVSSAASPLNGLRSMRADNVGGVKKTPVSNSTSTLTKTIVGLPADAYLYFAHQYLWETQAWDGGVVQYSTNNGATWTTFTNAQMTGELYPGIMEASSNGAFAGLPAYTGDSFGAASTRISLAALAGQSIKIRFFASADEYGSPGNPDGWWIDDVQIYTCAPASELLTNGGFEVGPARPPLKWTVVNPVGLGLNDKRACNTVSATYANSGLCAFRFIGGAGENTKLTQKASITGRTFVVGDQITLTGVYNSLKAPSLSVKVTVAYTDAASTVQTLALNTATVGYQLFTVPAVTLASPNVKGVTVQFVFKSKQASVKTLLDDLTLVHAAAGPRSADSETFRGLP